MTRVSIALVVCGLGAGACGLPAPPAPARLWTLDDYVALYEGRGGAEKVPPLPTTVLPERLLAEPNPGQYQLVMSPTFEEGYAAAYLTTDLWQSFNEIWVQPLYIQVTGWNAAGVPQLFPAGDPRSQPIFSVGPKSRFYSPYWEILYVKVPDGAPPYTSWREIADAGSLEVRAGGALTASLLSADLIIMPPVNDRDRFPDLPSPEQIGPTVVRGTGYLDGAPIDYLNFGMGAFQWDADRVVQEVPLFDMVFRDDAGTVHSFGGPKVGGSGPLFTGRLPQPTSSSGQPRYGAYWRLYNVEMPSTARIFASETYFKTFHDALVAGGAPVGDLQSLVYDGGDPQHGPTVLADDLRPFLGLVTTHAECFASFKTLRGCAVWFSSQTELEDELDVTAFHKTDLTVTCPFVSYRGSPVDASSMIAGGQ
ncbi:MAG TPA: hypothetical protein VH374_04070 [Polyangia bacterium]|jgi:hypothetical protein|nr:hypothetical protein [Polyangia bacterium]